MCKEKELHRESGYWWGKKDLPSWRIGLLSLSSRRMMIENWIIGKEREKELGKTCVLNWQCYCFCNNGNVGMKRWLLKERGGLEGTEQMHFIRCFWVGQLGAGPHMGHLKASRH